MSLGEVSLGQLASGGGESGGEEQILDVAFLLLCSHTSQTRASHRARMERLTAAREDRVEILLPILIEHLIGLIDDHVPHAAKSQNLRIVNELNKPTRRRDQNVAALLKLRFLLSNGAAAVGDARAQHGAVAELAGLVEDLDGELTSGNDDNHKRLGTDARVDALLVGRRVWAGSSQLLCLAHQLVQDGNQVRSRLART